MTRPSEDVLRGACEALAGADEYLRQAYDKIGLPNWRDRAATYQSLAMIVVYQLISTRAADAIWARVLTRHPDLSAKDVLTDDTEALLACGLSRPKLGHLVAIAQAVEGPVTAQVTASALQLHPDVTVVIDEDAARHLQRKAYYEEVEESHRLLEEGRL